MDKFQNVGFNKILNVVRYRQIKPYFKGNSCCEIGCGEGQITKYLTKNFSEVCAIDKEKRYIDLIPNYKNVKKIIHNIEKMPLEGSYNTIICSNVLEHIDNLEKTLMNIHCLGNKSSIFIFVTPNGESLNRRIGAKLGFIKHPMDLDKNEIQYGHKRSFNLATLVKLLLKADFRIIKSKTYFYKPYPNKFMEKLPIEIIENCERIVTDLYGAELLVICKIANSSCTT